MSTMSCFVSKAIIYDKNMNQLRMYLEGLYGENEEISRTLHEIMSLMSTP